MSFQCSALTRPRAESLLDETLALLTRQHHRLCIHASGHVRHAVGKFVRVVCATCRSPSWWTVAAPMVQTEPALSPLMLCAMHILLTLLQLRLPAAWKSMQLSVVMLWNAAVQSGGRGCHLLSAHTKETTACLSNAAVPAVTHVQQWYVL